MASLGKDNSNSLFMKIVNSVKDGLTKSTREDAIAQIVLKKRLTLQAEIGAQLHEAIEKQQKEVSRLQKDTTKFYAPDEPDKVIREEMNESQKEAMKKAKDRLDKMHKAYEKLTETGDTSDANNLIQSSGGKDKGTKGEESS